MPITRTTSPGEAAGSSCFKKPVKLAKERIPVSVVEKDGPAFKPLDDHMMEDAWNISAGG